MTVDNATVVLEILAEDPRMRVYQYRHARTGATLYALFPRGQWDDMALAPEVEDAVLLVEDGRFTTAGQAWRATLQEDDADAPTP